MQCFLLVYSILTHVLCSTGPSTRHRRWFLHVLHRWNDRMHHLWAGRTQSIPRRSSARRTQSGRSTWARFDPCCAGPETSPRPQSSAAVWSWYWWCALGFLCRRWFSVMQFKNIHICILFLLWDHIPVVRSSLESACTASMIREKVPCNSKNKFVHQKMRWTLITSHCINASALTGHVKPKFILMGLVKEPSGKVSGTWKELEPSTGVAVPP